jgi:hypothetical protein
MGGQSFQLLRPRWALPLLLATMAMLSLTRPAAAQTCLPYSQFMALTRALDMEVKLTYVGIQEEPIETVLFTSTVINLGGLTFCRQPGEFYGNDRLGVRSFSATSQEMTNLLELAGQIPAIQYGPSRVQGQYLSFALFSPASGGPGIGYEVVLRPGDAGSLLNAVRAAIADNPTGLRTINELGCDIALPEPGNPTDVSADFAIKFSAFLLDPASGLYVGTVTLANDSGSRIPGPVSLVLNVPPDVPLFNADGYTCQGTPIGRPFLSLPLSGGVFPPGGTIQLVLQFDNPKNELLLPTAQVLAGPGAR